MSQKSKLQLLPLADLAKNNPSDPIRYYSWPIIVSLYRKRVEMCLDECTGGQRVMDIGFGNGLTFINLSEKYGEIFGLDLNANIDNIKEYFLLKGIQCDLQNGNVLSMPYPDNYFDTVLLISILEHLHPEEQAIAMGEILRVLKPGGQLVYGVPVERPFMALMFKFLGVNIRDVHFSTEKDVSQSAGKFFLPIRIVNMKSIIPGGGSIYQIGHFSKSIDNVE